jgi:hypothetical protein
MSIPHVIRVMSEIGMTPNGEAGRIILPDAMVLVVDASVAPCTGALMRISSHSAVAARPLIQPSWSRTCLPPFCSRSDDDLELFLRLCEAECFKAPG